MSTTIDERVVEMRFDNKHFESNVATSMSTLEKLKQKLNLSGASKGLEDINTASKKVNMSNLGGSIDAVSAKFSAMQVIGVTALANITNSAVNAGKRIVSALTIDPVKTGFEEYETQINAVQTILSNTKSKGSTIDDVNQALDELNKYADLTIYNFTEMTRNIGTFTAAGIDLETSVSAIQGIANLAAQSGSTSIQASTAMYQLSQALATGTVKLMDWNSVVNAGMGGELFQNALKETSELLGTGAEAAIKAEGSFRDSLSTGWLTAEVLTETLKKFTTSGAAEYVAEYTGLAQEQIEAEVERAKATGDSSDAMERAAESIAKLSGKSKEEIQNILEFAQDAEDAATKVKTFTQLWDVLKESAQSGWSSTWKIIIGDFEEAKNLLTPLADTLTGFINKMSDWRNNILQIALDFKSVWTGIADKLDAAGLNKVKEVAESFETASKKLETFQDVVNKVWRGDFNNWGDNPDRRDLLTEAGYDHRVVQELVNKGYQYQLTIEDVDAAHKKFGLTMEATTEETKKATSAFGELTDKQLKQAGLTEDEISLYRALEKEAKRLGVSVSDLAEEMSTTDGRTLLIDSFKNAADGIVGIGKAIKDAWVEIFNPPGAAEIAVKLYGVIKSLNEFSEKLRLTDKDTGKLNETGKKLQRTFEGIFAVVDIVTTVLGGGLKIAFGVISQILGYFHLNILDVTAVIGDVLVKFHDWFESIFDISGVLDAVVPLVKKGADAVREWFSSFKASKGMQDAIKYIKDISSSIKSWWSSLKDAEDLPKTIAEGIINFFSNIPSIISTVCSNIWSAFTSSFSGFDSNPLSGFIDGLLSGLNVGSQTIIELGKILLEKLNSVLTAHGFEAISADAIAGLAQGLRSGAVDAWNAAVEMAKSLVEKVKAFLGIHSPSTVFAAIGGFIIAGLVMGLQNGIPDSLGAIKDVFQPMLDWVKGLDFSSIFAAILSIGAIGTTHKVVGVLETLASPLEGLGNVFEGVGAVLKKSAGPIAKVVKNTAKVVKSFSKVLNAVAFDIKAEGIKKLGETLLMLVGAIIVLTFFEPAELWNAVGLVTVLAIVLAGLAFAMNKINDSSASISKEGFNVKSLSSGLIGIGVAILLMAAAVKMLGSLDSDQAKQGFLGLAGLIVAIGIVIAAFGLLVKGKAAKNMDKFGAMMLKLSVALILMSYVVKALGNMDRGELIQGGLAIAAFAGIMVGLMAATKLISGSKNVDKIGSTLLKIALAIGVMAIVAKALGSMDRSTLIQGGIAIIAFSGIMVGLMAATKLISGSKNVDAIGGTLLKIAVAIGVMGLVAKLLGGMDRGELIQGGLAIAAFAGIMVGLMAATKLISGSKNVDKIGTSLLAISGAIAIMALTAFMLSMISWEGFVKGTIMIAAFAGIIVGLMAATKLISGSRNVDTIGKTLLTVSGAIAILAGIAVLLSLVPTKNLVKGVVIITVLAAVMAGLIAVTKFAKGCVGNIIALTVMIAALAGAVYLISTLDSGSAIVSAAILGGLMLVMTGVLAVLSLIGTKAVKALVGVIALAALGLVMREFVWVLASMDGLANAQTNAIALSILAGACTIMLAVLTLIGTALPFALAGVIGLAALGLVMREFVWVLASMEGLENARSNSALLIYLMTTLADVLVQISLLGPLAIVGEAAIAGLVILIGAIGALAVAIGALMEKFPSIQDFLNTGLPVLEQLAGSIGTMIGNFIGGVGEGLGDSLVKIGDDIAQFMDKLAIASDNASGINGESFDGVKQLMVVMAEIGGTSILTGITDLFSTFLSGESSMEKFVSDAKTFFEGMKEAMAPLDGMSFNEQGMNTVITAAERLSDLQSSLESIGGVIDWFTGRDDLGTFGANAADFIESMITAFGSLEDTTLNTEAMDTVISAATSLSDLQSNLEPIGGVISWFTGRDDLGTFGANAADFIESMITAFGSLEDTTLNTEAMDTVISAATSLSDLQSNLEPIEGVISWFTGRDDLGKFGENVADFIESMLTAFGSLEDTTLNTEAMDTVISAATSLSDLQSNLEPIEGVISWFTGRDDLGKFGENVADFIESMITAFGSLEDTTLNTEAMDTVISAATSLSDLQSNLEPIGGVISWFTGRDDLGTFGTSVGQFISSMKTAAETLGDTTINEEALESIIAAAKKLAEFQDTLEPMGGVVSWFTGRDDLGTFGTNIGLFADAMTKLKTGMGEDGISESVITSVTNAGDAIIALQKALPKEGLFDGKMNLSEFSDYVTDFATAMSTFGTKVAEIDSGTVDTAISTAYRIKSLITSLADLDTSGLAEFTGIGTGGFGADGAAYKIAQAIAAFSDKVDDINTESVTVAVTEAKRIKNLIASLVGLDTSGIENFRPGKIGDQMKSYADKVSSINTSTVSSSISSANRLKNFIASLTGLDTSGINNFKVKSIGSSLKEYATSVSDFNAGSVASSITAATRLKTFIASLSGLDTNGVSSFKSAVNELSTVNVSDIVKAFSEASSKMSLAGADMFGGLIKGMQSKIPAIKTVTTGMLTSVNTAITSKMPVFELAGGTLAIKMANGIANQRATVTSAVSSCLSKASGNIRGYYTSFYSSGSYLVTGFCNGITANTYRAAAAAAAMARAAEKAARNELKINSPSKVFREIGSGIPEGFVMGINMYGSTVKQSVSDMASTAITSARNTMNVVLDTLSGDMDVQPTIRPVIDLSDVKNGANTINDMFNSSRTIGVRSNLNAINVALNRKIQNGEDSDIVSAINKLRKDMDGVGNTYYTINGLEYSEGSDVAEAFKTIVRAARVGGRI